ncbi:hypothetical protein IDH50_14660 [Aeromicrobium tamlense]|uniref:Uncharacterized protein n=1 Tax=Aeromicrobium tamlense TaxID=375541 RepID=A0A8I0FVL1_9ACTN|nr:hypothetical protein [Aeromicrobium tamlense]MBD1270383.1 hypothetical protein [Aeromicrobium tamlense]MBD1271485.1 hypothetical protein [Aeromicrobium tamlense]NYI37769.1 hypothetical protein [Aeromicrobium tamlense]
MRIAWSTDAGPSGTAELEPGQRCVVARRMDLPTDRLVAATEIDGSCFVFVRLPYVSDPALVLTASADRPALYRGQRANGAIVEVRTGTGEITVPAAGQHLSLPHTRTEVSLRFPDLVMTLDIETPQQAPTEGSGTVQLGVAALEGDDGWLVGALAVALSPPHGVVAHGDLKTAFATWRGIPEPSDGAFDRNVLRPALARRSIDLPGPRLNKIVYLVERCRATTEFPPRILDEIRAGLDP